jgi:glycosyltransferase involved in cell wall biosynthesis
MAIIYVLAGPLVWAGLYVVSLFARKRMSRLIESNDALCSPPPSLAIVVPAKDEAGNIRECVNRLFAQDYPAFELKIINDRSTDSTGEQLEEMAKANPRLKLTHVRELPEGWLGKCHALHVGTRDLTSDWILFVDSDVNLAPDAARRMVAVAQGRGYEALSALPRLEFAGWADRLLLPLLAVAWGAAFTVSLTNDDSKPHIAAANGQLFLVRRDLYEKCGNHEAVKNCIVEDVELARHLKRNGVKMRFMLGGMLGSTKMHDTWPRIFHGWARIFAGTSRRSIWPMVGVLAVLWISTMSGVVALGIGLWTGWDVLTAWAGFHLLLVGSYAWGSYRASGQSAIASVLAVVFLPMSIGLMTAVLVFSILVCFRGYVLWRGSRVEIERAAQSIAVNRRKSGSSDHE